MSGPFCDVCGGPPIGVASSSLGAVSFAYCLTCAEAGAELYGVCVAMAALCGGRLECFAEWSLDAFRASASRAGKTMAEFWTEAQAMAEKMDAEMRAEGGGAP